MICPTCAQAADLLTGILTTGESLGEPVDPDTARVHAVTLHCGRDDCSCQHRTQTAGLEPQPARP
jgi:hypothetical protein